MKIALLTYLFPAKSETFIFEKANRLSTNKENEIIIFTRKKGEKDTFKEMYRNKNEITVIELFRFDWNTIKKIIFIIYYFTKSPIKFVTYTLGKSTKEPNLKKIRRIIHTLPIMYFDPDVIHVEFLSLTPLYIDFLNNYKGKKVVSCRGSDVEIMPIFNPGIKQTYNEVFSSFNKVHCLSSWLKEIVISRFICQEDKIALIPPSIDVDFFKNNNLQNRSSSTGDQFIIGSVSRLHWKKGHIYAIDSIKKLLEKGFNVKYIIVGDGEEKERLLFDIYDLNLEDKVEILGWLKPQEVKKFYEDIDVFLFPSISEGFGNVVLEAMSMQKPVIVTDVGCQDAITNGIEGLVVQRRNSFQITSAIEFLYNNRDICLQMGNMGRIRVEQNYRIENQILGFEKLYSSIIE